MNSSGEKKSKSKNNMPHNNDNSDSGSGGNNQMMMGNGSRVTRSIVNTNAQQTILFGVFTLTLSDFFFISFSTIFPRLTFHSVFLMWIKILMLFQHIHQIHIKAMTKMSVQ